MRILLLIHGFNALSQRVFIELEQLGHEVSIEFDINDETTISAVDMFCPDLILAPFLKRAIPDIIWKKHLCLIMHPGPMGDRGPSSIDWAVLKDKQQWGVTLLQAEAEMDAGPIWDTQNFELPENTKSSLYRNEVTEAAVKAIANCLKNLSLANFKPRLLNYRDKDVLGKLEPAIKQSDRKIDWLNDTTEIVLRKIRSADGMPGISDELFGKKLFLYDGREATNLKGKPGEVMATSGPAICRATIDGAVWIGHVKDKHGDNPFKLPATKVLAGKIDGFPEITIDQKNAYQEIYYSEDEEVGHLHFGFYNGAMSTSQCERLLAAYKKACRQPTKLIVLHGGGEFWSNGMHLNLIEAHANPAEESWRNINVINDMAQEIITTTKQLTIAAIRGNAGAGGVFLARACDQLWLRKGIVLNPHYKDMGNLYGSEFWTYLLPRYAGEENARRISKQRLPMGAEAAVKLGLADLCLERTRSDFYDETVQRAKILSQSDGFDEMLGSKIQIRNRDEKIKPLAQYRSEELEKMKQNFFGFDPSYHVARYNFVHKIAKSRTPITLARHRDQQFQFVERKAS